MSHPYRIPSINNNNNKIKNKQANLNIILLLKTFIKALE